MENTHKLLLIYLNVVSRLEYLKHCHIISLNASLKNSICSCSPSLKYILTVLSK